MKVVSNNSKQISLKELNDHFNASKTFILVYLSKEGTLHYCSTFVNHAGERGFCWRAMEFNHGDNDINTATLGKFEAFLARNEQYTDRMHFFNSKEDYLKWVKEF